MRNILALNAGSMTQRGLWARQRMRRESNIGFHEIALRLQLEPRVRSPRRKQIVATSSAAESVHALSAP